MTPGQRKWLAREWLIFVICLVVSPFLGSLLSLVLQQVFTPHSIDVPLWKYYGRLVQFVLTWPFVEGGGRASHNWAWSMMFGPYIGLQALRSTVWSIRVLRDREP